MLRFRLRFLIGSFLLFGPVNTTARKTDFPFFRVHAENFDFQFIPNFDDVLRIFDFVLGKFRDVKQAFQTIFQSDKDTEVRDFGHFALDDLPRLVTVRNVAGPRIVVHLFHAECNPASFDVDGQDFAFDFLSLFQHLVRMTDLASPGHVGNMQQAVDPLFQFDKGTVIGQVSDTTFDQFVRRVFRFHLVPRVVLGLFHTERHLFARFVDAQHGHIDFVANLDQFIRMIDATNPGHLADMNQTFNARFQFHEGTIVHHIDDFARID